MPIIRITCPEHALTAKQKEQLATLLIDAVTLQEVTPLTEAARRATTVLFTEIPQQNYFMGNDPFWLVEAIAAAGFFNQTRRDAVQAAIAEAFISVLGHDGSSIEVNGIQVSPSYLLRIYPLIIEIPEGSWGLAGNSFSAIEIGRLIGSDKDPERWSELKANTARLIAARPS